MRGGPMWWAANEAIIVAEDDLMLASASVPDTQARICRAPGIKAMLPTLAATSSTAQTAPKDVDPEGENLGRGARGAAAAPLSICAGVILDKCVASRTR